MNKIIKIVSAIWLCMVCPHFGLAQTAGLMPNAVQQFFDNNGNPLSAGTVTTYIAGTSTLKTTWRDSAETIPNTNPIVLDAGGKAIIYGDGNYRQLVKDRNGNIVWDAVTSAFGTGSASQIGDGTAVGTVLPWSGLIAPTRYAFAYGQELSRVTYSRLYSAITLATVVNCANSSNILTAISDTTQIAIGSPVEVSCVAAGTTVTAKTASTVTVSNNASVTVSANAIFYPWGNGNGTTTFNVPDLRGRVLPGRDNMGGTASARLTTAIYGAANPDATGAAGGSQSKTLITANLPAYTPAGTIADHTHFAFATASVTGGSAPTNTQRAATANTLSTDFSYLIGGTSNAADVALTSSETTVFTGTAQGGVSTPFATIQPSITMNYVVKILPDVSISTLNVVTSIGGMVGDITCSGVIVCSGQNISVAGVGSGTVTTSGLTTTGMCAEFSGISVITSAGIPCNINGFYYTSRYITPSGDNTADLQSLLQTVYNAGGGTIVCDLHGSYTILGQIVIPNTGGTAPTMPAIRITGNAINFGFWNDSNGNLDLGYCGFDLRYAGATAKIVTLGEGNLEIDHISLADNGATNTTPFIFTTNTNVYAHENSIKGSTGSLSTNDFIILGGRTEVRDGTITSPFQGYGTRITNNRMSAIRSGAVFNTFANAIWVDHNTCDLTCGSNTSTAITAATAANPSVLTITGHGWTLGQVLNLPVRGATGNWTAINTDITAITGHLTTVTVTDADHVTTSIDATGFGALTGSPVVNTGAFLVFQGTNALDGGNFIESNLVEMVNYGYFAHLIGGQQNNFTNNSLFDAISISAYKFETTYGLGGVRINDYMGTLQVPPFFLPVSTGPDVAQTSIDPILGLYSFGGMFNGTTCFQTCGRGINLPPSTALTAFMFAGNPALNADNGAFTVGTNVFTQLQFGGYASGDGDLWLQTKSYQNTGGSFPLAINPLGGQVRVGFDGLNVVGPITYTNLTLTPSTAVGGGPLTIIAHRTAGPGQYGNALISYEVTAASGAGVFDSGLTSWSTHTNLTGGSIFGAWSGANTPALNLSETYSGGSAIGMEIDYGNRWSNFGLQTDVGGTRYTVGLQLVPDVVPAPDGENTIAVTMSVASPSVITLTSHGFYAGMGVYLQGTPLTGFTTNTTYYVKTVLTGNTFTLAATPGGTAINGSGSSSGVTLTPSWPGSFALVTAQSIRGHQTWVGHLTRSDTIVPGGYTNLAHGGSYLAGAPLAWTKVDGFYTHGLDLTGVTCTTDCIASTGFSVSPSGAVVGASFTAGASAGLSITKTVRAAGGAGDCTLIFTGGLLTGGSC